MLLQGGVEFTHHTLDAVGWFSGRSSRGASGQITREAATCANACMLEIPRPQRGLARRSRPPP